jgi:YhcH/YjgK/YiaL family protein
MLINMLMKIFYKSLFQTTILFGMVITVLLIGLKLQAQSGTFSNSKKAATTWFNTYEWLNGLKLKPHKSVNKQEFAKQYHYNKDRWDKAFAFLKENDLVSLKPGKYPIDGENVFAIVTEGPTKDTSQTKWEAHKIYQDIHFVIDGKEKIGIAPVASAVNIIPYDTAKDIGYYEAKGNYYESDKNVFFIVFPQDAHRPGIKVDGFAMEKRIVIKVRRNL